MNLVDSAESKIKASLDKCAFDINVYLQDQSRQNCYEDFLSAISKYAQHTAELEVLQKIKSQIIQSESDNTNED